MSGRFHDRTEAGRTLAGELQGLAGRSDLLVLGLPRGGVPVAFEVARALGAPLDVFVVRKLGLPWQPELAMGAIASGGTRVLNERVIEAAAVAPETIEAVAAREQRELERREELYRGGRPAAPVEGKVVVLVDDGLATGSTMRAALAALRKRGPARLVVAVPVAARETCAELEAETDELVCVRMPEPFLAVGAWYEDFAQIGDDEIRELIERASADLPS